MRTALIALVWLVVASSAVVAADPEIQLEDSLGRKLVLSQPAMRVVSLAPHLTEVVFAAGAGDQLVGAVAYSDYPEAAQAVPRVGSYDNVSVESLVALNPDLVLAWYSGNGPELIKRVESLGLKVFVFESKTMESVAESLRVVGTLTGNEATAAAAADAFLQQILLRPAEYSVIATLNLNGDYISDALAAQVGGIGIAPGANLSNSVAMFEATHGTAPKYAGKDYVNPGSLILSAEMMLRHMGWVEAADLLIRSTEAAITAKTVTYDFARMMPGATQVSCSGFGNAMIEQMRGLA